MNGGCHCGAVTLAAPARPEFVNACNCTLCAKLGTLWGYYPKAAVAVVGETQRYVRADVAAPRLGVHFCPRCGATTHWSLLDPAGEMAGLNMRLFDPAELAGVEVRYGDRRHHANVEPRRYYREPTIFDGLGAEA